MKCRLWFPAMVLAAFVLGCNDDNSSDSKGTTARFELRLTDAPALYDSVIIDIQEIYVLTNGEKNLIKLNALVNSSIDLLELANGVDTLLAGEDIPAGEINQIRLVLDDDNYVVVNGVKHKLVTPSAQQSGLKLKVNDVLEAGVTYRLWIDFDASRSIVANPQKYILKPVIRTYTEASSAVIRGVVNPANSKAYAMAVSSDLKDTASVYVDEVTGKFLLRVLNESEYVITIEADGFITETRSRSVELGEIYDLGTIELTPAE